MANILYLSLKYILKQHGYKVTWQCKFQDYLDAHHFITTRHSTGERVKYMLLLYGHYGCFIFAVVMVLL
jgi:hypothetical protein